MCWRREGGREGRNEGGRNEGGRRVGGERAEMRGEGREGSGGREAKVYQERNIWKGGGAGQVVGASMMKRRIQI